MPHLLIVDDDPDFVEAIELHLERSGHSVESAFDRSEGMRLARGGRFDLLILDVMMAEPDDGIVMAQELRKEGFDKPILMLSGISRVAGMRYGQDNEVLPASDFLEKPVKPETLVAKVHALFEPIEETPSMLTTEQDRLTAEIATLVDEHGRRRSSLIPILQAIQMRHHVIGDFAMQAVADRLGIHPVEVYGVVTFYAFLHEKYHGRFVIRLCRTASCAMAGKDAVARQLRNDLGIDFGQTTPDGRFTLEWANCIGMCDQGPAMLVNDQVFTHVTPQKVHDILSACEKVFGSQSQQTEEVHAL